MNLKKRIWRSWSRWIRIKSEKWDYTNEVDCGILKKTKDGEKRRMYNLEQMSAIYVIEKESDLTEFAEEIHEDFKAFGQLRAVMKMIGFPVTVTCEEYYVDKVYRDSYYSYFASKYLEIPRNCRRLAFFQGRLEQKVFESFDAESERLLQEAFVGTTVLRPLATGHMGRTLLDPKKLFLKSCYIRTTPFSCIILGHELKVEAFPFSSQDSETMSCAETAVWDVMEYYATRYAEYRTVLPSNMIQELEKVSQERNLPSRGLDYYKISELLKTFGFYPRIYALDAYKPREFRRIFHYYIESGIPVVMGISGKYKGGSIGHSTVGIGHGGEKRKLSDMEVRTVNGIPCVDSADYYDEYVIMDDNQIPYTVEKYENLALFEDTKLVVFVVPLYKRIFLEAADAFSIVNNVLNLPKLFPRLVLLSRQDISGQNPLVIRLYLTSSRKYKKIKAENSGSREEILLYTNLVYPKFLWVAELSTHRLFGQEQIVGEIVLDATSSRTNSMESLIMVRYFSNVGYRMPDESAKIIFTRLLKEVKGFQYPYPMYKNNLLAGGRKYD